MVQQNDKSELRLKKRGSLNFQQSSQGCLLEHVCGKARRRWNEVREGQEMHDGAGTERLVK
jgi:hypothetical protein